jgi:LPXTG-motif cell wall-anchored protein
VDDVRVTADGEEVFADGAEEGQDSFALDGFTKETGTDVTEHYYLIEWRNYAAADTALQHIGFGRSQIAYDPGMVIWYVDNKFDNNWVADHPGEGFLNVVDAHRYLSLWKDEDPNDDIDFDTDPYAVDTDFQIADAAFSLNETVPKEVNLSYLPIYGRSTQLNSLPAAPTFDDSIDHLMYDSEIGKVRYPYVGTIVPNYGLKIHVVDQAEDMSTGTVFFHVGKHETTEVTVNDLAADVYSANEGHNELVISGKLHNDTSEKFEVTVDLVDGEGNVVDSSSSTYIGALVNFEETFTITEDFESGEYTAKILVDDVEVKTLTFTVDVDEPEMDVDIPTETGTPDAPVQTFEFTINVTDENVETIQYRLVPAATEVLFGTLSMDENDDEEWITVSNGETIKLEGLEGSFYIQIRAIDKVGNVTIYETDTPITVDNIAPTITLADGDEITHELGTEFNTPEFTVSDGMDKTLSKEDVTVTSTVDPYTIGTYTVTYTVADATGNVATVIQTVHVVDTTAPVVELIGDDVVTVEAGSEYVDPGVNVTDASEYEVVLTGTVDTSKVGEYVLTYTVTDAEGNETVVTRTVKVVDTTAPTIELFGDNPLILDENEVYVEPGYKATDIVDGNITDDVIVTGEVLHKAGEYTITYTVTDKAGNTAVVTRTVIVKSATGEEPGDDDEEPGNEDPGDGEDPGDKDPSDDDQGDDNQNDGGKPADGDKKGGGNLPDTATNIFNWLLAGGLTLLAGVVLYFIHRRRKATLAE